MQLNGKGKGAVEEIKEILEKILKPFELEKNNNYSNKSVIKGFDAYVLHWLEEAIKKSQDLKASKKSREFIIETLNKLWKKFKFYPDADKSQREKIVSGGRGLIKEIEKFMDDPVVPLKKNEDLGSSAQYLNGVGPKRAGLLKHLGISTIMDLLTYFPFRYEDRSHLSLIRHISDGEIKTIRAVVKDQKIIWTRHGPLLKVIITDGSGEAVMVCFNQFYIKDILTKGTTLILTGKFSRKTKKMLDISNFTYEVIHSIDDGGMEDETIHTNRIVPVYNTTQYLNMRFLRSLIKRTLDEYLPVLADALPVQVINKFKFTDYKTAVSNIHFPPDLKTIEEARRRLVFEEFFYLQAILAIEKRNVKETPGISYSLPQDYIAEFENLLPFKLTLSQKSVILEILKDMALPRPMNRLLQGDVGSGKTVVALAAVYAAIKNGYQAAFMAPTEILAEQHFMNLEGFLLRLGTKSALLVSGTSKNERTKILKGLAGGDIKFIIGTHALIEEDVKFNKLGFVIIDEQHKFGVIQRAKLRVKGLNPDVLVMTATPIPRTLALTVYGDLDVSSIKELPPGRGETKTVFYPENKRGDVEKLIRKEMEGGRQIYVVYPLIEESEKVDLKAATKEFIRLCKVYPEFKIGLLHGRLPSAEKEIIMQEFKSGKINMLVSTTVIEVGIDVPNASIMLIEHPERFGIAQLHQLRGRIGRGKYESTCILLLGSRLSIEGRQRIKSFTGTNNGFEIAEADLKIRGPGEFAGIRQHGMPEFRIANIIKDADVLSLARQEAFNLVSEDPYLAMKENIPLKKQLQRVYKGKERLLKVG